MIAPLQLDNSLAFAPAQARTGEFCFQHIEQSPSSELRQLGLHAIIATSLDTATARESIPELAGAGGYVRSHTYSTMTPKKFSGLSAKIKPTPQHL
ncbi:MAG TPA: hypothetical protein V6D14_15280 [Coleofasciculaceae cyanobacterium]